MSEECEEDISDFSENSATGFCKTHKRELTECVRVVKQERDRLTKELEEWKSLVQEMNANGLSIALDERLDEVKSERDQARAEVEEAKRLLAANLLMVQDITADADITEGLVVTIEADRDEWKKRAEQAEKELTFWKEGACQHDCCQGGPNRNCQCCCCCCPARVGGESHAGHSSYEELEQKVAEIDAALDNGADQDLWIPGTTRAEVVKKLRANLDELESKVAEQEKTIEALRGRLEAACPEEPMSQDEQGGEKCEECGRMKVPILFCPDADVDGACKTARAKRNAEDPAAKPASREEKCQHCDSEYRQGRVRCFNCGRDCLTGMRVAGGGA